MQNNQMEINLFENPFMKYTKKSLNKLRTDRLAIVQDSNNDDNLIADAAIELKHIKAVLDLFETAEDNGVDFNHNTTGIHLVEMATGKRWAELTAAHNPVSNVARSFSKKIQSALNKGAKFVVDKTESKY